MMNFRTEINTGKSAVQLKPFEPVMMTGSCFADNIAGRMRQTLWPAYNPFGMLFNPLSIYNTLDNMLLMPEEEALTIFSDSVFRAGNLYFSWMFDSRMYGGSRDELITKYRELRTEVRRRMTEIRTIFVTFGTAWCYALKDEFNEDAKAIGLVANCHKQPSGQFLRFRLPSEDIVIYWKSLIQDLRCLYPGLRFVFTVSPVRHLKDGIHENTLSKAILHLAIEELCGQCSDCFYFPAFELMMDDLRDYRFYAADMAHPSEQAVEYIWEHFRQTFMPETSRLAASEGEKLYKRLNHRPITGYTDPEFQAGTERLVTDFHRKYPSALI